MNKIFLIMLLFFLGLYFCSRQPTLEGFGNPENDCPNLLIQKGKELFLINKNKVEIPGVNPIRFENLEDYVEYLEWQRNTGIYCPVLYLQETYDAQNNRGYRILPDPLNPNAGLPSTLPHHLFNNISGKLENCEALVDANKQGTGPYNKGGYPGYDPDNQYIGQWTCLDKLKPKNTRMVSQQRNDSLYYEKQSLPPKYDSLKGTSKNVDEKGEYRGTYGQKWITEDSMEDPDFKKGDIPNWQIVEK